MAPPSLPPAAELQTRLESDPRLQDWRDRAAGRVGRLALMVPSEAQALTGLTREQLMDLGIPEVRISPRLIRYLPSDLLGLPEGGVMQAAESLRPNSAEKVGRVYFMEAVGTDRVKIGWTGGETIDRLRSLQTASPFELRILTDLPGSLAIEKHLHHMFERDRILPTAEWFFFRRRLATLVDFIIRERRWP